MTREVLDALQVQIALLQRLIAAQYETGSGGTAQQPGTVSTTNTPIPIPLPVNVMNELTVSQPQTPRKPLHIATIIENYDASPDGRIAFRNISSQNLLVHQISVRAHRSIPPMSPDTYSFNLFTFTSVSGPSSSPEVFSTAPLDPSTSYAPLVAALRADATTIFNNERITWRYAFTAYDTNSVPPTAWNQPIFESWLHPILVPPNAGIGCHAPDVVLQPEVTPATARIRLVFHILFSVES